jgi:hypothetical protein
MQIPLPWERLLWSGRPLFRHPSRERYFLTDLRLVRAAPDEVDELLLHDIGEIQQVESRLDRLLGTSTLSVHPRDTRRAPLVLTRVRHGPQLAALLEWMALEPGPPPGRELDAGTVGAVLAWDPAGTPSGFAPALAALTAILVVVSGVAIGLYGKTGVPVPYAADDPIAPGGNKRTQTVIVRYMEDEVMPWARAVLGPLKGGSDRITCETCHGPIAASRRWRMPAVAHLPQPEVRQQGWEQYGGAMDAQMRNAIYGYLAGADKQTKAAYMRDVVMPGMARLLRRPAYDFTQSYDYNRARHAFGCYHCHQVK